MDEETTSFFEPRSKSILASAIGASSIAFGSSLFNILRQTDITFFGVIVRRFGKLLYLCSRKAARTGFASAIQTRLIAFGLHRPCTVLAPSIQNSEEDGSNNQQNATTCNRQHEHSPLEQNAPTGGGLQTGAHHQAQYEAGGNGAKHDSRGSHRTIARTMRVRTSEDFRVAFKRLKKRHKSLQQDFEHLLASLLQNPMQGVELDGGA